MTLTEKALQIATAAHKGQKDKGGRPYILHPVEVASVFRDEIYSAVALLHDVVEDTDITLKCLCDAGFPRSVVDAIDAISKREDEQYFDYLCRVKQNHIACAIKLQDLKHNMQVSRIPHPCKEDFLRIEKYQRAYGYLLSKE